jgi:hypothetical protein
MGREVAAGGDRLWFGHAAQKLKSGNLLYLLAPPRREVERVPLLYTLGPQTIGGSELAWGGV